MTYDRALLRKELVRDEGLRLKVYRDTVGKLTVGVGRNLDRGNAITAEETARLGITRASVINNGLTEAQAMALLDSDIDAVEKQLDNILPWWRTMSPVRQRVILNMCFNMGIQTLITFKNTLRAMQLRRYDAAADGMAKSKWARQVGKRADRLEAMMRAG